MDRKNSSLLTHKPEVLLNEMYYAHFQVSRLLLEYVYML